jgi:hypothetical protein
MGMIPWAERFLTGLKRAVHSDTSGVLARNCKAQGTEAAAAPLLELLPERAFMLAAVFVRCLKACPCLLAEIHRCV